MDSAYILPFFKSIKNVFTTMLAMDVSPNAPTIQNTDFPPHNVSAIIGLSGDVTGSVVLSLPTSTAKDLVEAFLGPGMDFSQEDMADAIGELVNMIAGGAKAEFHGKDVSISTPTIIMGMGHRVYGRRKNPIIEIICDCDKGDFVVHVLIEESS